MSSKVQFVERLELNLLHTKNKILVIFISHNNVFEHSFHKNTLEKNPKRFPCLLVRELLPSNDPAFIFCAGLGQTI